MIWSDAPPTEPGMYYIRQIRSGRQFASTLSESGEWDAYDAFWENGNQLVLFGPPIPSPEQCAERDEHAQIGALLAKCGYFEVGRDGRLWWAWVRLPGKCQAYRSQGPTQLAAIRAAVEAAEKGVRE